MFAKKYKKMRDAETAVTGEASFGLERGLCRGNIISLLILGASAYLAYTNWTEAQRLEKVFHDSPLEEEKEIWYNVVGGTTTSGTTSSVTTNVSSEKLGYLKSAQIELNPSLPQNSIPNPYSAKDYLEKATKELERSVDERAKDATRKITDIIGEIDAHSNDTSYLRRISTTGSLGTLVDEAAKINIEYSNKVTKTISEIQSKRTITYSSGIMALLNTLYLGYHKHEVEEREGLEQGLKEAECKRKKCESS